jgi:hypothetical protein
MNLGYAVESRYGGASENEQLRRLIARSATLRADVLGETSKDGKILLDNSEQKVV